MSNEAKAALWTTLFTFLGTAAAALINFLTAVQAWVAGNDDTLTDDLSILGKVVVSAVIAGIAGLVNYVWRATQAKLGKGNLPVYQPAGQNLSQPR